MCHCLRTPRITSPTPLFSCLCFFFSSSLLKWSSAAHAVTRNTAWCCSICLPHIIFGSSGQAVECKRAETNRAAAKSNDGQIRSWWKLMRDQKKKSIIMHDSRSGQKEKRRYVSLLGLIMKSVFVFSVVFFYSFIFVFVLNLHLCLTSSSSKLHQ